MKLPKGIPLIVLACLAGIVASFTVHRYVTIKTKAFVKPTSQVVVASTEIAPGTALSSRQVKVVSWPRELIPPKAIPSFNAVQGRVAIIPIAKGEPVLLTKLAPEGSGTGLGALLDETKRAFTVRVDDVSGVAGFIHPGDRVDVLAELPMHDGKEHFSKTILQNIVVLTAGQTWEQNTEKKPGIVTTVTLELSLEEAEVLNLASNQGKIRLALRNCRNMASLTTRGVATSELFGQTKREKLSESAKAPAVEVIKGLERSQANL